MSRSQRQLLRLALLAVALVLSWIALDSAGGPRGELEGRSRAGSEAVRGGAGARLETPPVRAGRDAVDAPAAGLAAADPDPPAAEDRDAAVEGLVVDQDYEPVSGAWVLLEPDGETATTTADGSFRIPLRWPARLPGGRQLTAWKEGHAVVGAEVRDPRRAHVVLPAAEPLRVQVVDDETGAPVPRARAEWIVSCRLPEADGFFRVGRRQPLPAEPIVADELGWLEVPPGPELQVFVTAEGFAPGGAWVNPDARQIRLRRGAPLRLQLLDMDGRPIAGVRARFFLTGSTTVSDEQGWIDVSAEDARNVFGMQLRRGPIRYVYQPVIGEYLKTAPELVVRHFPRHGRLLPPDGRTADEFEVATSAAQADDSPAPDPVRQPGAFAWAAVEEDGSFRIEEGWQGPRTMLHARWKGSGRYIQQWLLEGEGPYEFALDPMYPLELRFTAEPPDRLEGACAVLSLTGAAALDLGEAPLAGGRATLMLQPGAYLLGVKLGDRRKVDSLGLFVMPRAPHVATFDLGGVRTLTGQVTAGGAPVFPCEVWAREVAESGFAGVASADRDGRWKLEAAPDRAMELRLGIEDPWLAVAQGYAYGIPADATRFDLDLPLATLDLVVGDMRGRTTADIEVQRYPMLGEDFPRIQSRDTRRASLPALTAGSASIRTTPCRLRLELRQNGGLLRQPEVELRPGERRTLRLDVLESGLVALRLRGQKGAFRPAALEFEPLRLDAGPGAAQAGRESRLGEHRVPGYVLPQHWLPTGTWRVTVEGPFRVGLGLGGCEGGQHGPAGSWSAAVPVEAGRITVVWLELDDDGSARLESEILDRDPGR